MSEANGAGRAPQSAILFAFAVALACYLAWLLRAELLLLYVSALFAVVLRPLVEFIAGISIRGWRPFQKSAIVVLILAIFAGLGVFAYLAVPPVVRDLRSFAQEMPSRLPEIQARLQRIPFADQFDATDLISQAESALTQSATYLLLSIKNWASAIFTLGMGIILTVYFTLEGDIAYRWALSFFPPLGRIRLDTALRHAQARMGRWLLGQCSLMLIFGVLSTIVYSLLGVRYAYALGVLNGLLNIIPVLGAAVSISLGLLAAAVDSWGRVLGVAIFYLIYQQLENSFLTPRIMRSSVGLPGLAILVALLLGSALAGIVGALVSVPTAALVAVLVEEYLVSKDS
ncbi:MAG TPA: AI-2E family transporter [Terracidiphilus sp.]